MIVLNEKKKKERKKIKNIRPVAALWKKCVFERAHSEELVSSSRILDLNLVREISLSNELRLVVINIGEIWGLDSSEDEWTPRKNFLELFLEFEEIPFFFFFF